MEAVIQPSQSTSPAKTTGKDPLRTPVKSSSKPKWRRPSARKLKQLQEDWATVT